MAEIAVVGGTLQVSFINHIYKGQRNRGSNQDNPKKLTTLGTQDEDKQNKKQQHSMH